MNEAMRSDERGVSTVIGAILVAAMVAGIFAHVQLYHAPVWEARAEEQHNQDIQASLADFHGALVGPGGVTAGASTSVPLHPDTGVFGPTLLNSDRVDFEEDTTSLGLELDTFVRPDPVHQEDASAWSETWLDLDPSEKITDVEDILNFRLRIEKIGGPSGPTGHVRVIAKDASDQHVGNFTVHGIYEGSETSVYIETTDGNEVIHYDNPVAAHRSNAIEPFWVDVLNSDYRYDGILITAGKPLTLQFEEVGLTAQYAITYKTTAADGSEETVGGVGDPVEVNLSFGGGGTMTYSAERSHLVSQQWVLEHGALILSQSDGAIFQMTPPFDMRNRSGTFHLSAALPVLEGEAGGVGGASATQLSARPITGHVWDGLSSRLVLNLTTHHPDLWRGYFEDELRAAGAPADNHTLTHGADWIRLEIGGPSTDPDEPDLSLSIRIPRYQLIIGG